MNTRRVALATEWKQNRRLRLGTLATLAILALYGILEWSDWLDKREKEYVKLGHQVRKLQSAVGTSELWQRRASAAAETRKTLEKRLWQATSLAVGQAAIEDWLKTSLNDIYASRPEIRVQASEGSNKIPSQETATRENIVTPLKVNVSFEFSAATLERYLGTIYSHPHVIRIVSLNAKKNGRIESTLEFQLKLKTSQPAPQPLSQSVTKGQQ